MRSVVLALGLLTVLGCSGVSSLIVENKTGQKATVKIATRAHPKLAAPKVLHLDDPDDRKETLDVPPGESVHSKIYWDSQPPYALDVEVSVGGKVLHEAWSRRNYPPGMAHGDKSYYFLEIQDDALALHGPSVWDELKRNSFILAILGAFAAVLFLIVRSRKAKR